MTKGSDNMYANLSKELKKKGLSILAAANTLGMPEPTFRTKVNDRSFSVEEAFAIKDNLFPEFDIAYLFERNDK